MIYSWIDLFVPFFNLVRFFLFRFSIQRRACLTSPVTVWLFDRFYNWSEYQTEWDLFLNIRDKKANRLKPQIGRIWNRGQTGLFTAPFNICWLFSRVFRAIFFFYTYIIVSLPLPPSLFLAVLTHTHLPIVLLQTLTWFCHGLFI